MKSHLITLLALILPLTLIGAETPLVKDGSHVTLYGNVNSGSIRLTHRDRSKDAAKLEKEKEDAKKKRDAENGFGITITEIGGRSGPKYKTVSKKLVGTTLTLSPSPIVNGVEKTEKQLEPHEFIQYWGVMIEYKGINSFFCTSWAVHHKDLDLKQDKSYRPSVYFTKQELRKSFEATFDGTTLKFGEDIEFKDKVKMKASDIKPFVVLKNKAFETLESEFKSTDHKSVNVKGTIYMCGDKWYFLLDKKFKLVKKAKPTS